jgi:hypothetical protein
MRLMPLIYYGRGFAAIDAATITSLTIQQMDDYFTFDAGNVVLQSGMTFRGAKLAYQTYGKLNEDKSNVILYMTSFAAHHYDIDWMVGPGKALDTDKYFVIIPSLFGNGLSSSPSNASLPYNSNRWPNFTMADNVRIQHRLLTERTTYCMGNSHDLQSSRHSAPAKHAFSIIWQRCNGSEADCSAPNVSFLRQFPAELCRTTLAGASSDAKSRMSQI